VVYPTPAGGALYAAHCQTLHQWPQPGRASAADLRFEGSEVFIRKDPESGDVILSRHPESWDDFFDPYGEHRLRSAEISASRLNNGTSIFPVLMACPGSRRARH
jgi:hypothetical protein